MPQAAHVHVSHSNYRSLGHAASQHDVCRSAEPVAMQLKSYFISGMSLWGCRSRAAQARDFQV